jgi:hypothetical protein
LTQAVRGATVGRMFIGHFALGFAAKPIEPRLSLGVLLAAPQLLDLVWPVLVLAGVERVVIAPGNTAFTPLAFTYYPWSHSLVASLIWSLLMGAALRASGASWRASGIAATLVASHWVLDFVSHRPDLPLWPDGPRVGLGLWRSVPATLSVEIVMYVAGVFLYARSTRAKDRVGTGAFLTLAAFLLVVYVANVVGPTPPSAGAVAGSALALWLIPLWGVWIERHRSAVRDEAPPS